MNLYALDTDSLSELERLNASLMQKVAQTSPEQLAIAVISVEERIEGRLASIRQAKTAADIARRYSYLVLTVENIRKFNVLPYTELAVHRYQSLLAMKLNVGKNDLRIAAIVLEHGAIVVTRNRRDFERVPGLVIEDWTL